MIPSLPLHTGARRRSGYAIMMVMVTTAAGILVATSLLKWSSTKSYLSQRNKEFKESLDVAESAMDKIYSQFTRDYYQGGSNKVDQSLSKYTSNNISQFLFGGRYGSLSTESTDQTADPVVQEFETDLAQNNYSAVVRADNWSVRPLNSSIDGLKGATATYRFYSFSRKVESQQYLLNVMQDVQCASVPLFQFGIFYAMDMEMNPDSEFNTQQNVTGRIHSNRGIYLNPANLAVKFREPVTASNDILEQKHPRDPVSRSSTRDARFLAKHSSRMNSYVYPIGMENNPKNLHEIIEPPPPLEDKNSEIYRERFFNKVDMIIRVDASGNVSGSSGSYNGFSSVLVWSDLRDFVSIEPPYTYPGQGDVFFNWREYLYVNPVDIDISKLRDEINSNKQINLRGKLGRIPTSIYVIDERVHPSWFQPGVRLRNGRRLPDQGLTVVTPHPLYVEGNYNARNSNHWNTPNTTDTVPAALIGDAITVLSGNWRDDRSTWWIYNRSAVNTTVNAAMIAGIVPTGNGYYSGGVENFARLLEDWNGDYLTINGSFAALFESETATGPWGGYGVYETPRRQYAFDENFRDLTRLPHLTPELRTIIRGPWQEL